MDDVHVVPSVDGVAEVLDSLQNVQITITPGTATGTVNVEYKPFTDQGSLAYEPLTDAQDIDVTVQWTRIVTEGRLSGLKVSQSPSTGDFTLHVAQLNNL